MQWMSVISVVQFKFIIYWILFAHRVIAINHIIIFHVLTYKKGNNIDTNTQSKNKII